MVLNERYSKWMYIIFPALAMMLGWGLRGHIGGGPFGAMIPGAMLALSLCMLLKLPYSITSIIVVFGIVGIGLGGEMTYGQTLGFLRDSDTVWWGTLGTTLKGGIWGLLGGIVLAIGFIYKSLHRKTIIMALVIMMLGMLLGFKLINQPMLLYFSNPVKPRSESWGALLLGAFALLIYLKVKTDKPDFKIVSRFALFGLIGGALGFGLGGFWMVLGNNLPSDILFHDWWKAMEFSFGFLLGGALGYAAWLSRKELGTTIDESVATTSYSIKTSAMELVATFIVGLVIFWFVSFSTMPLENFMENNNGIFSSVIGAIIMMLQNYAFYGLVMIAAILYFPKVAWQIGITLTFCHTVIDLGDDHIMNIVESYPVLVNLVVILISTGVVGLLVAHYQGKKNTSQNMLLLLIWSTVFISTFKIVFYPQKMNLAGLTFGEIVFGLFVVDIFFLLSAVVISWIIIKKVS